MRTLVIIPARGGSKRIPNKNLAIVGGKPLIDWTLELLPHLDLPDFDAAVSTECKAIAEHCIRRGVTVCPRPAELATDESSTIEVLQHAINFYPVQYESVICLQPTNPLRTIQDISAAHRIWKDLNPRHGIATYCNFAGCDDHPRTGEIYWFTRHAVCSPPEDCTLGEYMDQYFEPYLIPRNRAWCINEPCDIPIVEALLKYNGRL